MFELLQVLALFPARGQLLQEAKRTKCGNVDWAPIQGTICPKWLFQYACLPCLLGLYTQLEEQRVLGTKMFCD